MAGDRLVAIGEIGRPHGLRGEVRVTPLTDHPERFETLADCVLWDEARDRRRPCRISGTRVQGDALLVTVHADAQDVKRGDRVAFPGAGDEGVVVEFVTE